MYVVTVEFRIDPASWDEFLPLMIANARRSRSDEPGCGQFDVSVDASRPATIFLYELYDDRAAFDEHLASAHYKAFAAATRTMIVSRSITTWHRIVP